MKVVAAVLAVLAIGCAEAQARTRPTSAPTTTTTFAVQLQPVPTDPEGARCQTLVNEMVSTWQPLGRVEATVTCVPIGDPRLAGNTGATYPDRRSYVGFPTFKVADSEFLAVAAHELGHSWRLAHFTRADLLRYKKIRGIGERDQSFIQDYADLYAVAFGQSPRVSGLVAPVTPELIAQLQAEHLLPK